MRTTEYALCTASLKKQTSQLEVSMVFELKYSTN